MITRSVISEAGTLLIGEYKGRLAYDIARQDPEHLVSMLNTIRDMDPEDAQLIETLLLQSGSGSGTGHRRKKGKG